MARSSSIAAWETMAEPGSSENDTESPEVEEDELRTHSMNLKRKSFQLPRASPKRPRTDGGAKAPFGSSSLSAKFPRLNGNNGASKGSQSTNTNQPRGSDSGPSRPPPLGSAIAGTSRKESSRTVRSSQITAVASLQNSKSPRLTQLSKSAGQVKGKERAEVANIDLPVPRSRSSSGPTKIPSKSKHEVIELTDSSDSDARPVKPVAKPPNSVDAGPPSTIRIPSAIQRLPPKSEKRPPSSPPEGVEVITVDDSDEEIPSVPKPLPRLQPRSNGVSKKETIGSSQPSPLPSVIAHRPASTSSSTPKLTTVQTPSWSTKHTSAPNTQADDDSDKMDVDSNNPPSTAQPVPDGRRSANRSDILTQVATESPTGKSTPTAPLLDSRSGKRPLPGRNRSLLSVLSQHGSSKLPADDTREPRPPVLPTKSPSQATPPSAAPRRSSGLDLSGLKDVLTDAVSLSRQPHTQSIQPPAPSSRKDSRPVLHSSETSTAMLSDVKEKQKEQPVPCDSDANDVSADLSKYRRPTCIDLTLDSDDDLSPPAPPVPRPLPLPKKSSELLKQILTKPEPPPSPMLPKASSRSVELETGPSKTASPATTSARNSTPSRPMPLPLPAPRPRPPDREPSRVHTPASTSASRLPSQEPNTTSATVSTSAIEDMQPTDPSHHLSSPIDDTAYNSDGVGSGSGSTSVSGSSPIEAPQPMIPLPHRTARKSTRGRLNSHGLLSPGRQILVSPLISVPTSETGSSLPASSSQPLVGHSPKPDNLEICRSQTSEIMEVVTEVIQASSTKPNGTLIIAPQKPIPPRDRVEPMVIDPSAEYAVDPALLFDDDFELEYVDDPVLQPYHPEPPTETDSTEMMDVEELLTASRQDSPISLPGTKTQETTPDPIDMSEAEGQQLRRSTRSSRSASGEPMDLFLEDNLVSSPPNSPSPPEDFSIPAPIKTFGGFQSLNWRTYRQDPENLRPKCYFSKDLPHTLQDTINSFSEIGRRHRSLRGVMEAAIRENTAEDEPDAPPIEIINEVDDDPTPPWEFHYSNKMWLGEDVPLPDLTKVVHCNCVGRCDPKTKPCACAERQRDWADGVFQSPDFLYDGRGHVRATDYPVFECNDLCGCGDECRNRVVQHGRKCAIRIQKTQEKGWGVFAGGKKIPAGSFIGVYAGELLTDRVGEIRGITYNKFGRTYLFDLDFWHLKEGKEDWDIQYTVDAYHAGNFTRFLNHSCDPNCSLVSCYINDSDLQKPLLTVFAKRDIEPNEELCFSYSGESGDGSEADAGEGGPRSSPAGDKDAVYIKCACKAWNCTGYMFK